jgi:hypothetical protein
MTKEIKALLTFEMMGKPEAYLKESMDKFVQAIESEKNIKILNKNVYPTKEVENKDAQGNLTTQGDLFSTFAEIELETNLNTLFFLIFKYMPSHMEIIYPEKLEIKNLDLNTWANDIIGKLHNYDAIAKSAIMNNNALAQRLNEIMQQQNNSNQQASQSQIILEAPAKQSKIKELKQKSNSKKTSKKGKK